MIVVRDFAHPRNALSLCTWLVALLLISYSLTGARLALADESAINLVFAFGDEKKDWLEDVTKTFNEENQDDIHIELRPMVSGDLVADFNAGTLKPQLVCPSSDLFLQQIDHPELLDPPPYRHLVKSPFVIAMWEERAKALGWPNAKLGWHDLAQLAERGWGMDAGVLAPGELTPPIHDPHPEWGRFKFAYADPQKTDSGAMAVLVQGYAANNKISDLTQADVSSANTRQFLASVGRAISYNSPSTVKMGAQMSVNAALFDAAFLFESQVVVHNLKCEDECSAMFNGPRLVAIYPREGTVMTTHPLSIVKNVTAEERIAAEKYIAYLLAPCRQKKAMKYGFRPGVEGVAIAAPVDLAHGVDPEQPKIILEIPHDPAIVRAALKDSLDARKPANIILAIDISGSMEGQKLKEAVAAAKELVDLLGDKDRISIYSFNYLITPVQLDMRMGVPGNREKVKASLDKLKPESQTLLHKAVEVALKHLEDQPAELQEDRACIIVLSDGKDYDPPGHNTGAPIPVEHVEEAIRRYNRKRPIAVFTIGYGIRNKDGEIDQSDLDPTALREMAAASGATYHLSSPEEIRKVFKELTEYYATHRSAASSH